MKVSLNSFNQTNVELKHSIKVIDNMRRVTFNQTNVELKPVFNFNAAPAANLLIRPMWN